jgi:hypothetical protein
MRTLAAGLIGVFVLVMSGAAPVSAWGLDVHRLITQRAIEGLPADLRPFYLARAAFVVEHSVDPDLWRVVGLKGERGDEDPNHFLDIDGLDEPRPFAKVPRDWEAYVARYGAERANRMGRLPWRIEEMYGLLVARFRDAAKPSSGYAAENAAYLSAVIAHYVEDAHVPFHAVLSYDGQATNQRGIHSRFESELAWRNRATLKLAPVRIRPIPNVKAFVFERLVEGEALVDTILAADRSAIAGREFYDAGYYAAFLKRARPVLERRVSEAASGVASVIVAAWTEAGKPKMPAARSASAPARIRR